VTVDHGGHFLPLDRPEAVIEEIETLDGHRGRKAESEAF